jgi:hypothetical protein
MVNGSVTVDMQQVKARKDAIVRQSNEGVTSWLENMANYYLHIRLKVSASDLQLFPVGRFIADRPFRIALCNFVPKFR